jgi:hypothetical protein
MNYRVRVLILRVRVDREKLRVVRGKEVAGIRCARAL